ncbi:MAG: hypothetical protein ING75_15860 [Rhodocyclaceae bacterium]|nr:hypothetical protein [Rhodocyclaceae bacterium]
MATLPSPGNITVTCSGAMEFETNTGTSLNISWGGVGKRASGRAISATASQAAAETK